MDIKNKFSKTAQQFIVDAYKEYGRYSVVLKFEDGFTRSIGEYTLADIKAYVNEVIKDRNYQQ